MSELFTAKKIAEFALRRVGTYAVHDTGADPDEFSVAMDHLDMLVAEVVATEDCQWLYQAAVNVTLPANTTPVDIVNVAGTGLIPANSFQFIKEIWLRDPTTLKDSYLNRISRAAYEAIDNKSLGGIPTHVFVDRTEFNPKFYFWPVPTVATWIAHIVFYKYEDELSNTGPHGFPESWQRFLTYALAVDLGTGPIVHLEPNRAREYERIANQSKLRLFAIQNREHRKPRMVAYRDF